LAESLSAVVTFHETLGGSDDDIDALLEIHAELFPQYAYYQPFMRERVKQPPDAIPGCIEHWQLIKIDDVAAGISLFKYIQAHCCGLVLAIAVRPAFRSVAAGPYPRLAQYVLMQQVEQIKTDTQRLGQCAPVGLAAEVEDHLLARYQSYGFVRLPVAYAEPSFTKEAHPLLELAQQRLELRPMNLLFYPIMREMFDPTHRAIIGAVVNAFLVNHYGLSEDHWLIHRTMNSVED
jgi:hypothetical protein